LAKFIYAKKYHDKFIIVGIKHFINACIQNGLVNRECLLKFVESSAVNYSFNRDSEYDSWDDDYNLWDDDYHSSSASEIDNRYILDSNNNLVDSAVTNANALAMLIALFDIDGKFPLSLKSLARIKVKNSLISYSKKSIEALSFLPQKLQAFLMFQDEIDEIKRLTVDNEKTQNNLD
jgi:hypothetical protein